VLEVNDTLIKCGLPGGMPGSYKVHVNYPGGQGDAAVTPTNIYANVFNYTFWVDAVYPAVNGSIYGGTLLTIYGMNFLTGPGETLVNIGLETNWICKIQTINETTITCLTPPIHPSYQPQVAYPVIVTSRLTTYNECPNNSCNFTYSTPSSCSNLTALSATNATAGTWIDMTGDFTLLSGFKRVGFQSKFDGKITLISAVNCNSTYCKFTPTADLVSGWYFVTYHDAMGFSSPMEFYLGWNPGTQMITSATT
jgi:hypothetical protein